MDKSRTEAQNVVAMSDYQPDSGYAPLAQVEGYWNALRGQCAVPKRSDVDPRGIAQALAHAFILERISMGIARLRVSGNHLNDLMGIETRGMPLTAFFAPDDRRDMATLLEEVFQMPAVAHLWLSAPADAQRPLVQARMVLLPLTSDLGDVSRILGCLVTPNEFGTPPRRFNIASKKLTPLSECAPGGRKPGRSITTAGFAEPKAGFPRRRKTDRPHLRLVIPEQE